MSAAGADARVEVDAGVDPGSRADAEVGVGVEVGVEGWVGVGVMAAEFYPNCAASGKRGTGTEPGVFCAR